MLCLFLKTANHPLFSLVQLCEGMSSWTESCLMATCCAQQTASLTQPPLPTWGPLFAPWVFEGVGRSSFREGRDHVIPKVRNLHLPGQKAEGNSGGAHSGPVSGPVSSRSQRRASPEAETPEPGR